MKMHSLRWSVFVAGAMLGATLASAGELRTAGGTREIHPVRQASHAEPAHAPIAEAPLEVLQGPGVPPSPYDAPLPVGPHNYGACGSCQSSYFAFDHCAERGGWGSVDYLLWWRRGLRNPPLVATSGLNQIIDADGDGIADDAPGDLDRDDTFVLFGDERTESDPSAGGRIDVGLWLDHYQCWGVGGRFIGLGEEDTRFTRQSDGTEPLGIPFFNLDLGEEDVLLLGLDDELSGSVDVNIRNEVYSGDLYLRKLIARNGCSRVDFLAGAQFSSIDESLRIDSTTTELASGLVQDRFDLFETENEYYGGEIGLLGEYWRGCTRIELLAKVGFGTMNQRVRVRGATVNTLDDQTAEFPGGLFAQPSNIGVFEQDEFSVSPEVSVKFGWQITPCLDFTVGYGFIFWSDVLRPAQVIDRGVDPTEGDRPRVVFDNTDFWVQGLTTGVAWKF